MFWPFIAALGIWFIECSYLPQIHRLWKRKEADGISPFFPGLNLLGRMLAMVYAWHVGEMVLAVGFFFGWSLRLLLLGQVIYYRWGRPALMRRRAEALAAELSSADHQRVAAAPSRA